MSERTSVAGVVEDRARVGRVHRTTKESDVEVLLDLDGSGICEVSTGLPFFDHMLSQLGRHGGFDLVVKATGDLEVDAHHTVEDTGLSLGKAFADALGDKVGIQRFASIALPLDEALVDVALDCSGRPFLRYDVELGDERSPLGSPGFDPQLAEEFFRAFVMESAITLHLALRYGKNTHHILEASFKGTARALRAAVRVESASLPSTKGVL
jgi:imidazoleglycerol-phosphate dehydratase